ncbi:MAG: type II toxin-antitoxin system death-on-curing family toxin [bacterium]|nr:type II toxin-antitoxin system death-on-curing family toxin [bacterium]
MRYLNQAEVFAIHKYITDNEKSSPGVRDHGSLFSLCEKPKASFDGIELYTGVFAKAAILMEAIVNYHVFIDANKRTAWISTYVFLRMNGYRLDSKQKEAHRFIVRIAKKKEDIETITVWIQKHSQKT